MASVLHSRLNRLEGRTGSAALLVAATTEEQASALRAAARDDGRQIPFVVVTGSDEHTPPVSWGTVKAMLASVALHGRAIHERTPDARS